MPDKHNKVYVICKTGWDCKHSYRVDKREFIDYRKCLEEAHKVNGYVAILKVKNTTGYWHNLCIEW